ncbi:hypothetical protein HPB48_002370 [Haemaphysalis longicornis]|uniref:Uncharacterized protein n=1 Tax=Haemaphysalis longicornis TaxID=44386 RepID=A0A9J6GG96_HAELO|nr:hypothetical protein HPB48_002370 [Haemaphysalis longicornis]
MDLASCPALLSSPYVHLRTLIIKFRPLSHPTRPSKTFACHAGAIPAATVFGFVIDNSCVLWNTVCEKLGACAVHDNEVMSRNLFTAVVILKTMSMLFFVNALVYLRSSSESDRPSREGATPECESSSNNATPPVQPGRKAAMRYRASSVSLY